MSNDKNTARLIIAAVIGGALLVAIVLATGGGFPNGASSPPTAGPTASAPTAAPAATVANSGQVKGSIALQVSHRGHTYHFRYVVKDTGKIPVAGFQLNGAQANLFHVQSSQNWNVFGSGICNGQPKGVLVYWSTNASSPTVIRPGHSGRFSFDVNTTGTVGSEYALSWGVARPQFGTVTVPRGSTMKASGPCT